MIRNNLDRLSDDPMGQRIERSTKQLISHWQGGIQQVKPCSKAAIKKEDWAQPTAHANTIRIVSYWGESTLEIEYFDLTQKFLYWFWKLMFGQCSQIRYSYPKMMDRSSKWKDPVQPCPPYIKEQMFNKSVPIDLSSSSGLLFLSPSEKPHTEGCLENGFSHQAVLSIVMLA